MYGEEHASGIEASGKAEPQGPPDQGRTGRGRVRPRARPGAPGGHGRGDRGTRRRRPPHLQPVLREQGGRRPGLGPGRRGPYQRRPARPPGRRAPAHRIPPRRPGLARRPRDAGLAPPPEDLRAARPRRTGTDPLRRVPPHPGGRPGGLGRRRRGTARHRPPHRPAARRHGRRGAGALLAAQAAWVRGDRPDELPRLVERAFGALSGELFTRPPAPAPHSTTSTTEGNGTP